MITKIKDLEYIKISNTGIKASRIGLGTWAIGGWMWGGSDEQESIKTIHRAFDMGINVIDTAPVYGFGRSEEIVGKAIKEYGEREKIIVATKVGIDWKDGRPFRDGRKDRIKEEIKSSLKRLQTDYIDIYQVHWPDPHVSIEETAKAMNSLYEEGIIKAIGVSNYSTTQMDSFREVSPLHVVQPPYNLFEREIESTILDYKNKHNISTLAYGALCRGLLSDTMTKERKFTGDDLRKFDPKFKEPRFDHYLKAVEELKTYAKENYDKKVIHLAVRWLLDKGAEIPLWGARRPEQLQDIEGIMSWKLSQKDMENIDEIISKNVTDPVGPEFMAPPARKVSN